MIQLWHAEHMLTTWKQQSSEGPRTAQSNYEHVSIMGCASETAEAVLIIAADEYHKHKLLWGSCRQ